MNNPNRPPSDYKLTNENITDGMESLCTSHWDKNTETLTCNYKLMHDYNIPSEAYSYDNKKLHNAKIKRIKNPFVDYAGLKKGSDEIINSVLINLSWVGRTH